jgi:hypothetical protein
MADSACHQESSSTQDLLPESVVTTGTLPPVVLSDTRGPFELLVYSSVASTVLCLSGSGFTSLTGGGGGSNLGVPAAGTIVVDRSFFTSDAGQAYTVFYGRTAPDVRAVTLTLSDGSSVVASTGDDRFAAWWPSGSGIASAQVTGSGGSVTQPLSIESPSQRPIGGQPSPTGGYLP